MIYLEVKPELVVKRVNNDRTRQRVPCSIEHVTEWQQEEKSQLRTTCRDNDILFAVLSSERPSQVLDNFLRYLQDFQINNESYKRRVTEQLDELIADHEIVPQIFLVFDADRTLCAEDTGTRFWEKLSALSGDLKDRDALRSLFSGPLGYSTNGFRQANLLYEEKTSAEEFSKLCDEVAREVVLYPEFVALLKLVAKHQAHIGVVVVTCGLRWIWEKVLDKAGLSSTVGVIGGGRIEDGIAVTPEDKAAVVSRLKKHYRMRVWAFGDSPLDLPMMRVADNAVVVVGEERTRSMSMDDELQNAIDNDGLRVRQFLVPTHALPRLEVTKLPLLKLSDLVGQNNFLESILLGRQVNHATETDAAKLLMTATRDANNTGPVLRDAHHRIGWYLAMSILTRTIGLEEYPIDHVQGSKSTGHRFRREQGISIVVLMRGGEPMGLGVSDAMPLAMFIHANEAEDLKPHHIEGQHTIVLVDSVVNSGKSIKEFMDRIRETNRFIRVVVVAGVVQDQALSGRNILSHLLLCDTKLSIVTLRVSQNKFTGKGGIDTGNRLFNTTHID